MDVESSEKTGMEGNPGQGPFIRITLGIFDNRIVEMGFRTHRCGALSFACCELKDMVQGQSVEQALAITPEFLLENMGWLPLGKRHYPQMVVKALRKALLADADKI